MTKKGKVTSKKIFKNPFVVTFLVFASLVTIFSIYHVRYAKKIIPGVTVAGTRLSGVDYYTAGEVLANLVPSNESKVQVKYVDQIYETTLEDLGVTYDWDTTIRRAYEVGRTGNFLVDSKDKLAGLVKPLKIKAFYSIDENALDNYLALISGEINVEPTNASFILKDGELTISESAVGLAVERDELYSKILKAIDYMDFSRIEAPVDTAEPVLDEKALSSVYKEVETVVFNPMKVTYEDEVYELTPEQLLNFVAIEIEGSSKRLTLNDDTFESYLETLGGSMYKAPRGKVTALDGERVQNFEITESGQELDKKAFQEDFKKAFFSGESTVEMKTRKIEGPADAERYGIFALLGKGTSQYVGSAASRVHNLTLAAERTDGVLVPPGSVYSFNNSVGEISGATGYDSAYIISNGQTILGEGGGVCQTSTTLFRAVLNSGLPVVTRYPHAYRVYYYEQDKPVGFDASIYQPSLDFQFKNDTPNYVLIQTAYNTSAQTLEFSLYGTPDGREVEISEPVVTNQTPPPEASYTDDPTLPKGVVKQVDFSAWGATVSFNRTVTRDGEEIINDEFSSRYQPWQAKYLVGTKTD